MQRIERGEVPQLTTSGQPVNLWRDFTGRDASHQASVNVNNAAKARFQEALANTPTEYQSTISYLNRIADISTRNDLQPNTQAFANAASAARSVPGLGQFFTPAAAQALSSAQSTADFTKALYASSDQIAKEIGVKLPPIPTGPMDTPAARFDAVTRAETAAYLKERFAANFNDHLKYPDFNNITKWQNDWARQNPYNVYHRHAVANTPIFKGMTARDLAPYKSELPHWKEGAAFSPGHAFIGPNGKIMVALPGGKFAEVKE
jgi:hypothetical protein